MTVKNYTELIAWQEAMAPAETAYRLTAGFPPREIYGLASAAEVGRLINGLANSLTPNCR